MPPKIGFNLAYYNQPKTLKIAKAAASLTAMQQTATCDAIKAKRVPIETEEQLRGSNNIKVHVELNEIIATPRAI